VGVSKVKKLLNKLAVIQEKRKKQQFLLQKGRADRKVGVESNYQADIVGGEKLINKAQKQLQKLDTQERALQAQIPKGQLELDLNLGGLVSNSLMNLKY